MTERCEPPEGLRDVDGWHFLEYAQGEYLCANWTIGTDESYWNTASGDPSPEEAARMRWRYLAPVTPPAVVAALVEALEGLTNLSEEILSCVDYADVNWDDPYVGPPTRHAFNAARAALAAYRAATGEVA